MSTFSVDGLSSGLDTSAIIEQLMEVEAIPKRRLEQRRDGLADKVDAWTDLGGRLGELDSAIESIVESDGSNVLAGRASNEAVTVTPSGPGAVGVYELTVQQMASSHQLMSGSFEAASEAVGAGQATILAGTGTVSARGVDILDLETGHYTVQVTEVEDGTATIVFDGQVHEVDGDRNATLTNDDGSRIRLRVDGEFTVGTLVISTMDTDGSTTVAALVSQLNDPAGAAAVQVVDTGDASDDPFRMVVTARTPGEDNALELDLPTGSIGGFTEIRAASNTVVTMGDGSLQIERSDITVDGVVPGMSVDLTGAEIDEVIRVDVTRDTAAIVENVKTVIDAANAVLSGVSIYGRSDPEAGTSGILNGEFSLRRLESGLRAGFSAVGEGAIALASQIGIETSRDGTITLNEETFTEMLASDYGDVQAFLTGDGDGGYFGRIRSAIEVAIEQDGVIENATSGLDASIDEIEETIDSYERRLDVLEAGYRRRFTAMETLLAQLNSQSSFLASQLTGGAS